MPSPSDLLYPPPILLRSPPGPAAVAAGRVGPAARGGGGVPRKRVYTLHLHQTVAARGRTTMSTPLLIGPLVIEKFAWRVGTTTNPPNASFILGYSPTVVTEDGADPTTPLPFTRIDEWLSDTTDEPVATARAFAPWNLTFAAAHEPMDLKIPLNVGNVHVCVAFQQPAGGADTRGLGQLTVWEGLTQEQLENLL